jgi:hypothetical protein
MRCFIVLVTLFAAPFPCFGADNVAKAVRVIDGQKTTFPPTSFAEGVRAFGGVLESCHDISDGTVKYTVEDLKKARKGDHVSLEFTRPQAVTVLGKQLKVSEAVFAGGVFWLRCGNDVVRCTKYEYHEFEKFQRWFRQTLLAD